MRTLLVVFLFGHAAVHGVMWTLPFTDAVADMPFNPARSWLLGESRTAAAAMAGVATVTFVVAAVGYGLHAAWWPVVMLVATAVSLLLMVLWFSPWWTAGIGLSAALAVHACQNL